MKVLTEDETMDRLLAGASLTRFGDGEFKIARGGHIKSQSANGDLCNRLQEILAYRGTDYLVGIPRIDPRGPKNGYWVDFMASKHTEKFLDDSFQYASALITRPDSAPWIDTNAYWQKVLNLWSGKHVCLVWGGSRKSLTPAMLFGATKLDIIQSLPRDAWKDRKNILAHFDALPQKPDLVVMVLGPTATGMIPDFVERGVQAIDLGHIGAWMRPLFKDGKEFVAAHGFFWPGGAEDYGQRYIRRAQQLNETIRYCHEKRSCIQAGGHVGVWPKFLSGHFDRVYTFEPDHMNFVALNKNVPEKNVFRYQAVLGADHAPVNLVNHPNNIGGHHVKGEGYIPTMKIDDLGLSDVDLIQLDVEGSELAAIAGAVLTIAACKPVLHLEMKGHIEKYRRGTTDELRQLLKDWGYEHKKDVGDDSIYVPAGRSTKT